jgi:hypothetical protein
LIRDVSKALFRAPYRLEILLTVLASSEDSFTSGTVHAALLARLGDDEADAPDASTVSRTLTNLREAGLVESAGKGGKYRRVDSKFWKLLGDYSDELERRFAPRKLGVADKSS